MRFLEFKKYHLVLAMVFLGAFYILFSGGSTSKVFAACGATVVGPHGYAAAVIDVKIRDGETGQLIEAKGGLYNVNTLDPKDGGYPATSPGGNIYNLDNGHRLDSANFGQVANTCAGNTGTVSLVFGYGTTSQPQNGDTGRWALDCDLSVHPGVTQKFRVSGVSAPSNADPGYWENTVEIGPANGTTAYGTLIWHENGGKTFTVKATDVSCTAVEWRVTGTDTRKYRIAYSPDNNGDGVPDSNTFIGPWSGAAKGTFSRGVGGVTRVPNRAFAQIATVANPNMNNPADWATTGGVYYPPDRGRLCNPTNAPLNYSVNISCTGWSIPGFSDSDVSAVSFSYVVYEANPGNVPNYGRVLAADSLYNWPKNVPPSGTFNFQDSDNYNGGVIIVVSAGDRNIEGTPVASVPGQASSGACYSGTCTTSVVSNVPGGPANSVKAGSSFTVNYTISDNVPGKLPVPNNNLSLTLSSPLSFNSGPGRDRSASIQLTAPNNVTTQTWTYYPDFAGHFPIGANCPVTVDVYLPFKIVPHATDVSLTPTTENPKNVTFRSNTEKTTPPSVDIPGVHADRKVTRNAAQIGFNDAPNPYNATDTPKQFTDMFAVPQPNQGDDAFCGFITVFPAEGWIGPGGKKTVTVPSASDGTEGCDTVPPGCDPANPSCNPCLQPNAKCGPVRVVNLPYVKAYGGDVVAGGGFKTTGGSCAASPTASGILAYLHPIADQQADNHSGSGGQLGAFAWGSTGLVSGFASADMRANPPTSAGGNKLTFGNTATGGGSQDPILGGKLDGDPPCLPDYFTETQYSEGTYKTVGFSPVSPNSLVTNKQTLINGDATINGEGAYAQRHTVYVDGDAKITGNIVYTTTGITDTSKLPNFTLVVRGNIYVSRSVSRLDGTYIAQPSSDPAKANTTGRIYTCADNTGGITNPNSMYSLCGRAPGSAPQLQVYGSFIAEKVILNRTLNSLRDSTYREDIPQTKAAEVFTFSPDVYISPPVFRPKATVTSGDYLYIATLPPIL